MKLPKRMTLLLAFLQELDCRVTEENVHQLLFLYCHKYTKNEGYHFVPKDLLQYSIQLLEDQKFLQKNDLLIGIILKSNAERHAIKLDMFDKFGLQKLKNDIDQDKLEDITAAWNDYFQADPSINQTMLYTIGYEGISLEQYICKLLKSGVKCLCDVRRNPYSQKYGFSKAGLQEFLAMVSIDYVHMPELGVASSLRGDLNNDTDYYKLLKHYETEILPKCSRNIEVLEQYLEKYKRVAITCFEANVSHCHRGKIGKLMRAKHEVRDL